MRTIMQSNIPRCPQCSSGMMLRYQDNHIFYYCEHCGILYKVLGKGQIDNEILISDNINMMN